MAPGKQPLTLMNIPLEVRHQIFEFVATRDVRPEKLLRHWFEKKEVKEKTAELAAQDPNVGALRVVYEGDRFEHEQYQEDDSEQDGDGEEDSDRDSDEEEGSDEDGDEDGEDHGEDEDEEAEEQDAQMDEDNSTAVPTASVPAFPAIMQQGSTETATTSPETTSQGQENPAAAERTAESTVTDQSITDAKQNLVAATAAANTAEVATDQGSTTIAPMTTSAAARTQSQDHVEASAPDADMNEDGQGLGTEDGAAEEEDIQMNGGEEDEAGDGNEDADSDSDEEMADEDEDEDTAAGAVQPPAPFVTAHRKWRHIPQFMRITHCPPPVELLLTSKQLNAEAKSWFYDVAVLRIEATGSFAHTSFFEEAFSQITEAAFSPTEDIRKVEVTFVWDTTWLRSDRADCAAAIFPALLRQRAIFVTSILARAPNLSEVTIHWHDSAKDEEAMDLMNDVLMDFLGLGATVKIEPHYIAADAKPYRKSIAGKQRVDFQRIVNNGLDRLF